MIALIKKWDILDSYICSFPEKEAKLGTVIIKEGEQPNKDNFKIFFIKKGEIILKSEKNLDEVDIILKTFGYNDYIIQSLPSNYSEVMKENLGEEFFKTKFKVNLSIGSEKDIIGLTEIINGRYFCSAIVNSYTVSYYEIDYKTLARLISMNKDLWFNLKEISEYKRNIIADSLYKTRKSQFQYLLLLRTKSIQNKVSHKSSRNSISSQKKIPKSDNLKMRNTLFKSASLSITKDRLKLKRKKDHVFINKPITNQTFFVTKEIKEKESPIPLKVPLLNENPPQIVKKKKKIIIPRMPITYDGERKLKKSNSQINLLAYDNFNRKYNTFFYYKYLVGENSIISKEKFFDFRVNVLTKK